MMAEPEWGMIAAINAARAERGLHALAVDERLADAAERHAQDMATHPGIVHIGSDGSSIEKRIRDAGYAPVAFGEVVAWGWQGEVAPALKWWLNSPGHVGYVLSPEYTEIGVGYATGLGPWGHYWAVDFGRPATVAPPPPPPRPYTSHVPIVVGGTVAPGIDLLDYLRGDGRAYRVGNRGLIACNEKPRPVTGAEGLWGLVVYSSSAASNSDANSIISSQLADCRLKYLRGTPRCR